VYNSTATTTISQLNLRQQSTGDAFIRYDLPGSVYWSVGVDNSNSDQFTFSKSNTLGTTSIMTLSNTSVSVLGVLDMNSNNIDNVLDISMTGALRGNGTATIEEFDIINANTKNFDIVHPTKGSPWRLQYSVLEGPEHSVYLRGKTNENVIELPEYWTGLVHEDSLSVHLTPIGTACVHYVTKIEDNKVYIDCQDGLVNCYYSIFATRKDVLPPKLEYIKE
jgi:hypothetical protein